MATLYKTPTQNNTQYTLNTQLAQSGTTAVLNQDVSSVVQAPGVFVIDRVDSSGNTTPSTREYVSFTGVSTTNLTGLSRGLAGSTDQVHNVGAIVEFVPDVVQEQALYSWATLEHTTGGAHLSLPSINYARINMLSVPSQASIQLANIVNLVMGGNISTATTSYSRVGIDWAASGASLQSFVQMPTWVYKGIISGASAALGNPLTMPFPGTAQWITATLRTGSSNVSVGFDIMRVPAGGASTSLLIGTNVLSIPINGTFVSTASIANLRWAAMDVLNFSILNAGSFGQDLTIQLIGR